MSLARRELLLGLLAAAGLPVHAQQQHQSDAAKPIRVVVPFAAGGGNDVFARQMAKGLGELRKSGVIVDNKPGAGGNLGTEQVVRSAPDGSTLLLGHTGTVSINPALYKGLKFDARKDLVPVAMFESSALVLVVPAASKVRSVADLVAEAKARPGMLDYASSGSGTGGHLTGELFAQRTGTRLNHIPYKGTNPALTDLAGGQVQMMFSVIPPALALVKSGRLRAIAVTGDKRLPSLPDVPTVAESGLRELAGFESTLTYGLLAPRGTPDAVVRALAAQMLKVAGDKEFQSRLDVEGAVPLLGGPAEYAALISRESEKWAAIVKSSGATAQ
ncbi:tripartite-type tricarboxylate transporter receptor subunit TctC [Variovorax boronicumulans]|uniref:Bug family tripartite tricarboxylate transporter substrate binding protein n=1 Tax=Variovorax boronicumulans TaxID=436515 RepID=UPI0027877DC2|nr:tripartite tricarboxylate transporter substrate binding protein [Variovorax boronicumulans]MDP9990556.1 tripartite-type tricarboxylate transporter receptor subunit TctC [Variovorax boronicumulans]MDQ0000933.1 tripartite-type tricarboxylate transporter receptor subunit TctC [Variovorax boronicumulans]